MNKSSRFLAECAQFLTEHAPEVVTKELVKPFPESELHEKTLDVLKSELLEARRVQHLIPQFSDAEAKHFVYVDEATAVITYKQLDELNKKTLKNYVEKSAIDMQIQGQRQGAAIGGVVHSSKPEDKQKHGDKAIVASKTANKRFAGILKATRRLASEDVEQIDELSKDTLGSYVEKSSDDGDVKAGREKGVTKAAYRTQGLSHKPGSEGQFKKYKTDDVKTESTEPLEELSVKTLKNYKEKASDAVGSYKYGSKGPTMDIGTVNKRVKGFVKAGSKLSDRIKSATTLIKSNESIDEGNGSTIRAHAFTNVATSQKIIKDAQSALDAGGETMWPGPKAGLKRIITVHKQHIENASKKVDESEQIDELNKDTLFSYKTKAEKEFDAGNVNKKPKTEKEFKSLEKRVAGIDKAETRLQKEDLDEARGPLKGHPYHTKSDAELNYIVKDAGEAAQAMKGHNSKAELKYIDQVNDASTVLHHRKNGGKRITDGVSEDVTEGYMKTIKRHFQGWGDTAEKPKDISKRVSGMSDAALASSRNTKTKMEPEPHTPEATQRKLVDREFNKRTKLPESFDRSGSLNRIKNLMG